MVRIDEEYLSEDGLLQVEVTGWTWGEALRVTLRCSSGSMFSWWELPSKLWSRWIRRYLTEGISLTTRCPVRQLLELDFRADLMGRCGGDSLTLLERSLFSKSVEVSVSPCSGVFNLEQVVLSSRLDLVLEFLLWAHRSWLWAYGPLLLSTLLSPFLLLLRSFPKADVFAPASPTSPRSTLSARLTPPVKFILSMKAGLMVRRRDWPGVTHREAAFSWESTILCVGWEWLSLFCAGPKMLPQASHVLRISSFDTMAGRHSPSLVNMATGIPMFAQFIAASSPSSWMLYTASAFSCWVEWDFSATTGPRSRTRSRYRRSASFSDSSSKRTRVGDWPYRRERTPRSWFLPRMSGDWRGEEASSWAVTRTALCNVDDTLLGKTSL